MKKRRQQPNDERVQKLDRMLAEMVVVPPPKDRPQAVQRNVKANEKEKTRVKEEPVDPQLKRDSSVASLGKPIAMSVVDFSMVLGLVFGGCCRCVRVFADNLAGYRDCSVVMSGHTSTCSRLSHV